MSEKEEEFPFQQLVQALSDNTPLLPPMRPILNAIREHNAYWTYSALSTLVEMLRSKEEDPSSKCRCLQAAGLLMSTQEYPALTLIEVYLLPLLQEAALFRSKKTEEQTERYFQQTCSLPDSPQLRKDSVEFVGRAIELIFLGAASKPHRMVEVQELKQPSLFAVAATGLSSAGIPTPKWKWVSQDMAKKGRKDFLGNLRKFQEDSQGWAQFLLVNLLQEVRSGKKELLQLRQLLAYGQNYLTSPVINVCEDELNDLGENFEQKRRYLGLLSQLVRCGDIQAIIMIKNSEFLPAIASRAASLPGHLGTNQGQQLFPEIHASKQAKRQFYCDFLRALQNWAKAMPEDYDSEEFNIRGIYKLLKEEKKFKFPDNLLLARYQKETKENLIKNLERNEKLVEILEQTASRQPSLSGAPFSRSNMNPPLPTLSAQALQAKLSQAQDDLKALLIDPPSAEAALQRLTIFKDNWITYLQSLNLQQADEEQLQAVVSSGQKCVEQIQLIVPLGTAFTKGKITHKEFKQRIAESLQFHLQVSKASNLHTPPLPQKEKSHSISISALRNSRNSQVGNKSKIAGRELRSRIKQKSKLRPMNALNLSRPMDRSNISRFTDRSRADRSKFTQKSKVTERSRVSRLNGEELGERSKGDSVNEAGGSQISIPIHVPQGNTLPKTEKTNSIHHQKEEDHVRRIELHAGDSVRRSEGHLGKSLRSQPSEKYEERLPSNHNHNAPSKMRPLHEAQKIPSRVSRVRSKQSSHVQSSIPVPNPQVRIEDYGDSMLPPQKQPQNYRQNSSRRSNGSRILLRRSSSKLQHSRDSVRSNKGSSLIKTPHQGQEERMQASPGQGRTVRMNNDGSQLRQAVGRQDETIELNGKSIQEGSISIKKSERKGPLEEESLDHFKDEGLRQISSIIHSSAKAFHNSAEQIFSSLKKDPQPPSQVYQINGQQQEKSRENFHLQNKNSSIKPSLLASAKYSKHQPPSISIKNPPQSSLSQSSHPKQAQQPPQQQDSSNDIIVNPDLAPMRHSFHQNSTMLSPRKLGQNPQFKEVFANKYEGLESREREERMLRNNSGLKNIIKGNNKTVNKDSIAYQLSSGMADLPLRKLQSQRQLQSPRLHVQYGGSYQSSKDLQFQQLQEKKNREITLLREKIQQLQKQTLTMRTKLVAKDNELRSIKNGSVAGSERNFQFTSPGDSRYDRMSRSQSRSEKGSLRGSSVGKGKGKASQFQRQVQSNFRQYLQRIQGTTFRKSLLKQKCLIHKSDQLQIGCLSQTGEALLQTTLYITPHRYDLVDLTLGVQHDSNLRVKATPEHVKCIGSKRQQKVSLTIQVLRLPFCLPQLQINYKAASEYASNYHRLVLPLAFNKLCAVAPLSDPPGSHLGYLRTDDFRFNPKIAKLDKLGECFTGWSIVPPAGRERQQWLVMGKCRYGGSKFSLCLNLGEKSSWIQGFLLEGDPTPMRFLICTYKDILDASKK